MPAGQQDLEAAIEAAIVTLRVSDGDLMGTTERAVVARLMIYLDRELSQLPHTGHLRLDMEYERTVRSVNALVAADPERAIKAFDRSNPPANARRQRKIVPDLIYHQRDTSINHLVIEVKVGRFPAWQEQHDLAKLSLLTGRVNRIGMDSKRRFHPFDPDRWPNSEEVRRPEDLSTYSYGAFLQLDRINKPITWI